MKKNILFFLVLLSFSNTLKAQSDTTEINQSGYFLTFVKKVYLNPTVYLRTQDFKENTNLSFVALPDLASDKTNASSGFEKGLQKVLRFLMQSDGGVRFYFNPDSTTHPFRFWYSDNLHCKFKQADKDSIDYYLNHNFADGNISMTNALRFETTIDKALDYIEKCITANPQACGEEPQNETTEINTKPLSVSLHNRANSKYDIDVKQYEKLESNYAKAFDIHTQQDWYAPAKLLVANETAEPVALAIHSNEGDFLKQNIKIEILKTHALLPIDQASTEDSLFFSLPSSLPPGDPVEVIVKYKSPKDSNTYTVGFFMVNAMEREVKNLVLIPANGFVISPEFRDSVETELEKIYGQASVDFSVTVESVLFPDDLTSDIQIDNSGLFSNYTADLRGYVSEIHDMPNYESENYYLVIGLTTGELNGYMPRARNIGFIFSGAENKSNVIAHEIGHGAFHFRHIFSEEELGEESYSETQNIMDYVVNPKDLYLHQWNFIKDPAFVSWFGGDDEEGANSVGPVGIPSNILNKSKTTYSFITPGGQVISFKKEGLKEFYTQLFSTNRNQSAIPIGVLMSFEYEDKKYYSHFVFDQTNPNKYTFKGYYTNSGGVTTYFIDNVRKNISVEDRKTACMGTYQTGFFSYDLFKLNSKYISAYDYKVEDKVIINIKDFNFRPYDNITIESEGSLREFSTIQGFDEVERFRARNLKYVTSNHMPINGCKYYLILAKVMDLASYEDEIFYKFTKFYKFDNWEEEGVAESVFEWAQEVSSGLDLNSGWDEKIEGNLNNLFTKFKNEKYIFYEDEFIPAYLKFEKDFSQMIKQFWSGFGVTKFNNFTSSGIGITAKRDQYIELMRLAIALTPTKFKEDSITTQQKIDAVRILTSTRTYFWGEYETSLVKILSCVTENDANDFLNALESQQNIQREGVEQMNLTKFIFKNVHNVGFGEQYTEIAIQLTRIALSSSARMQDFQNRATNADLDMNGIVVPHYYTGFWTEVWHGVNPWSAPSLETNSDYIVEGGICKIQFTSYKYKVQNIFAPAYIPTDVFPQVINETVKLKAYDLVKIENKSEDITFTELESATGNQGVYPAFIMNYMDDEGTSKTICDGVEALLDIASIATGIGAVLSTISKVRKVVALVDVLGSGLSIANNSTNGQNQTLSTITNAVSLLNLSFNAVDFVKSFKTAKNTANATKTMADALGTANLTKVKPDDIKKFINSIDADLTVIRNSNDIDGKLTVYMLLRRFETDYKILKRTGTDVYEKLKALKYKLGNDWKNIFNNIQNTFDLSSVSIVYRNTIDAFSGFAEMVGHQLKIGDQVIGEFVGGVFNLTLTAGNVSYSSIKKFLKKITFKSNGVEYVDEAVILAQKSDGAYVCIREGACFLAGTKVRTRNGFVNIEDVHSGDEVLSFDEEHQNMTFSNVNKTFSKISDKLQKLIVGSDTIWTTPNHLFKTIQNNWVQAKNLTVGTLLMLSNGSMMLNTTESIDTSVTVYNFEVENTHTYTVGNSEIVVHNDCEWFKKLNLSTEKMNELLELEKTHKELVKRMAIVFGENSDETSKFLKVLKDNPSYLAKFDDNTYSIKAWKLISKNLAGQPLDVNLLKKLSDDFKLNDKLKTYLEDSEDFMNWKSVSYLTDKSHDIDFLNWNKKYQNWTSGHGQQLYKHIFKGSTGGSNGISGVHHSSALTTKTSGFDVGEIRIKTGTKVDKTNGFYEAEIEFWDGTNWITKTENGVPIKNGFFPDSWSEKQIMEELAYARSKVQPSDWFKPFSSDSNSFRGKLTNGQNITLYIGQPSAGIPAIVGNYTYSIFPTF